MVEWKSTLKTVFVGQVNCEKLYKIVLSKLVQLRRSCVVFETWVKRGRCFRMGVMSHSVVYMLNLKWTY